MNNNRSNDNNEPGSKHEENDAVIYSPSSLESSVEEPPKSSNTPESLDSPQKSQSSDDTDMLMNINFDIETGETDSKFNNSSFYIKSFNQNQFEKITPNHSDLENLFITDISFHSRYILSNSPVNSGDVSDVESESNDVSQLHVDGQKEIINSCSSQSYHTDHSPDYGKKINSNSNSQYKKLSYKEVEKFIEKYYDIKSDNKYSNEIDILTTFINGQKNLYIQAKYITQYKLNLLTFPSVFFTAFATISTSFTECHPWSSATMTTLHAMILLLLSLINYLKYESAIQIYLQNARQCDKLLTSLEMANNRLLFIKRDRDKNQLVLEKIKEIEEKNSEINSTNNVLIPEEVKNLFPVICNVNIFSFIKKIEYYKKTLINKLTDIKNEIRFILYKWENNQINTNRDNSLVRRVSEVQNVEYFKEKSRLMFLYEAKHKLKDEILELLHAYTYIDTIFSKEISNADSRKKWLGFYYLFFCFKKVDKSYCKTNNLVIDKYFNFIFADS
jgi:hypothetical protein